MGIFEKASRLKMRINYKGMCTVESLWDLSLNNLDEIYRLLKSKQKLIEGESLLSETKVEDSDDALAIEIVTHIVRVKQGEARSRTAILTAKARASKLKEIIESKKDMELNSKSISELEKELNELDK